MNRKERQNSPGPNKPLPGGLKIRCDGGRVILSANPALNAVSLDTEAARALADELKKQAILLENGED